MPRPPAVQELLSREWLCTEGADVEQLAALQSKLPFRLPDAYLALLRASNGGEGPVAASPLRLCLFEVAFAETLWKDPFYREEYSDYYFFGSNGGGESLAIDVGSGTARQVVSIDCIAGLESKEVIAPDFGSFLRLVGCRPESDA